MTHMRKIDFNCGYEELLAIAMMRNVSFEDRVRMAENGITFDQAQQILGPSLARLWERELEWCDDDASEQVYRGHVFYGEEDYPDSLAACANPPFCLAWKGAKPSGCAGSFEHAESVTIVGTRHSDLEGRRAAYLLALECAENGIAVYSGYATGIDQSSHSGASDGGGRTFAVMPCGLAHSYAFRERSLAAKIYDSGGGFVSQFLCDEEPYKWNFHYRNRILAQISDVTVVVQAPRQSGALITAADALDAGKDVFVHAAGSGPMLSREGTQGLVNDGAMTISCLADLSQHTFNAFKCDSVIAEISYDDIRDFLASAAPGENVYRYADKYYRFVRRKRT